MRPSFAFLPAIMVSMFFVGVSDGPSGRLGTVHADGRRPVFESADLRRRDFAGANLNGASFQLAQLQDADFSRARLRGTQFSGSKLNNAKFIQAQLQRAEFATAELEGTDFTGAQLQGADLGGELQGAKLARTNLLGVLFGFGAETQMQGADLTGAQLIGADLGGAQLQGASLRSANLQGADLREANLQGADLSQADLRGANLSGTQLQGASLRGAKVWRTLGTPAIDLADLDAIDLRETTRMTLRQINEIVQIFLEPFRDGARERLSVLNPLPGANSADLTKLEHWKTSHSSQKELAELLLKVACGWRRDLVDPGVWIDAQGSPHILRGLIRNGRLAATGNQMKIVADALRSARSDPAACPGIRELTEKDWAAFEVLVRAKRQ